MFDLEKALADWKLGFQPSGAIDVEKEDELESHLRDSIRSLERVGLSDEEAFAVAAKRLGHATTLDTEFAKNGSLRCGRQRALWMLSGYLGISLFNIVLVAIGSSMSLGFAYAGVAATTTVIMTLVAQLLLWLLLFWSMVRVANTSWWITNCSFAALLLVFVALSATPFLRPVAWLAMARIAEPMWMAEVQAWQGFGQLLIQMVVYAAGLVLLHRIRQSHAEGRIANVTS